MRILILVEGGVVQQVRSSEPAGASGVDVFVFDVDNKMADGKWRHEVDDEWAKAEELFPNVITEEAYK